LCDDLRALLRIRRENRALQLGGNVRLRGCDNERILFFSRSIPERRNDVLVAVSLDLGDVQEGNLDLPLADLGLREDEPYEVDDLLDGSRATWRGSRRSIRLDPRLRPAHVLRLVRRHRLGELP